MNDNIEGQVVDLIRYNLAIENREIMLDDNLVEDLQADSLDIVELNAAIENEFCIDIDDSDFEELKTVQDIITFIQLMDKNK